MRAPTELEQKWLDLLRSGTIKQFQHGYGDHDHGMCCLNVAFVAKGFANGFDDFDVEDTRRDREALSAWFPVIDEDLFQKLINMNDIEDKSFTEIADYIEQQIAQSNQLPEQEAGHGQA